MLAHLMFCVIGTSCIAQEKFGLGIIVGEPTGVSVKYWLTDNRALDGAAAWSLSNDDEFQLHVDHLWHNYNFFTLHADGMPSIYYGVGGRVRFEDNDNGRGKEKDDETRVGIRIPVGLSYLAGGAPIDIFVEIVPILEIAPDTDLNLDAAIGLRYYFL